MKQVVLVLLLLLLIPLVSAVDYPSPKGYVSDYADVISPEYEAQINALAGQIETETTAEIAILTVNDFGDTDINNYAVGLFREWGIGKKDVNNGLLILVKPKVEGQDGEWRIEVGYGMEGLITDGIAGRIGRNVMVPRFIEGDYGKGIFDAVAEINGYISGEEEIVSKYQSSDVTSDLNYFYVIFFIALIVGGIVGAATKKVKNKKVKWGVRLGVGAAVFIGLIFWSWILAIIFLALYFLMSLGRGGRGFFFFGGPRFGGGHGGGGFGGFGGGFSGGGGAGGRW
ncbi:TPM domain-containing protein [Candidatus Woesearchaeota archaeon]|nr:TPM domain-containing protein [Candidatus Woesearchaeota archaeon]